MSDELTLELARAAGLNPEWADYRGRPHSVPLDTLRMLLARLDLPASDERKARDSLERLHAERAARIPALLVGRVGAPLALPPSLHRAAGCDIELRYEDGGSTRLHCGCDEYDLLHLSGIYRPGYHALQIGEQAIPVAIAPAHRPEELWQRPRRWGLAAQVYSLRHDDDVGDLGLGDYSALAHCARRVGGLGAQALAISPVHALFSADVNHYSPYSPSSRLFFNALHVDPASVAGADWLRARIDALGLQAETERLRRSELVDWPAAATLKLRLLRELWRDFERIDRDGRLRRELSSYRAEQGDALHRHACFEAIHAAQYGRDPRRWHWRDWPDGLRDPDSHEVAAFAREHVEQVAFHAFLQWLAERALAQAQRAARDGGMDVGLVSDLAVGTDSGGSHAWSRRHDMLRGVTIGAPPDELNRLGQDWGLTTFSPRALRQHGFAPFIEMLRASLRHAGGVRIDHILGLNRLWLVPDGVGPVDGAYIDYPLHEMMNLIALEAWRHRATVVGEDLGTVPEGFRDELARSGLLGMRVLYFEREHGCFADPSRWSEAAIAMTSTHDLPTIAGWWRGRDIEWQQQAGHLPPGHTVQQEQHQRESDREALWNAFTHANITHCGRPGMHDSDPVVDAAIDFVAQTPAPLAIVPIEDLLGRIEQPNLPGTTDQHPNWRRRLDAPFDALLGQPQVAARIDRLQARRGGR